MACESEVALVRERVSKDFSPLSFGRPFPFGLGRFMAYGFNRDVVASRRLPLEQTLAVDVLAAPRGLPVGLISGLILHESEKVATHPVVIESGLGPVRPTCHELVREGVDEQSADRHDPCFLPGPHHSAKSDKIAVASGILGSNRADLGPWIGRFPGAAAVGIGECIGVCRVVEDRHDLERDPIQEADRDHLSIGADACAGIGFAYGVANGLKQGGLTVPDVTVVSGIERWRQFKDHVEVAKALNGGIASVRSHVEAVRGVRRGVPEVGVQTACDVPVAPGNGSNVVDLDVRTESTEPVCQSHYLSEASCASARSMRRFPCGATSGRAVRRKPFSVRSEVPCMNVRPSRGYPDRVSTASPTAGERSCSGVNAASLCSAGQDSRNAIGETRRESNERFVSVVRAPRFPD